MDVKLRSAKCSDIEAITRIGIAAFPYEPQWNYRYPYRKEYPEDHYTYTRMRYLEWLSASTTPNCSFTVAEMNTGADPQAMTVVALGIWRLPSHCNDGDDNEKLKPPYFQGVRRDANAAHMKAFRDGVGRAQNEVFDTAYGDQQLSLAQLATDPRYFRRGVGTKLVKWGLNLAKRKGWTVTVFAGPRAYGLYGRLGFERMTLVKCQVDGEDDYIEFPGMAWRPGQR